MQTEFTHVLVKTYCSAFVISTMFALLYSAQFSKVDV